MASMRITSGNEQGSPRARADPADRPTRASRLPDSYRRHPAAGLAAKVKRELRQPLVVLYIDVPP